MKTKYMRMSAGKDYQVKADQLVNIVQDIAETAIQYGMSIETDKEAEDIAEKNLDEAMGAFLKLTGLNELYTILEGYYVRKDEL